MFMSMSRKEKVIVTMKKLTLLIGMALFFTACERSVGPITELLPTNTPVQPPASLDTLTPPPTATTFPTGEPGQPADTPAATETSDLQPTQAPVSSPVEGATATPIPATSTPGPTPTATLPPFDPRVSLGEPEFTDPMTDSSFPNWRGESGTLPDTANIRLQIAADKLVVTGKKLQFSTWWFSWPMLDDFFIEMTLETDTCAGRDAYGLILRGPPRGTGSGHGYIVAFSCDGHYLARRVDGTDPYSAVELINWTRNENIKTGSEQTNRIAVRAEGNTFRVFANGFQIAEFNDSLYARGRYGVFVAPGDTQNFTYRVEEIAYWEF